MEAVTPKTRSDMELVGCDIENCTHNHSTLTVFSPCHPEWKKFVHATYHKADGTLRISCPCGNMLESFQIA